MGRKRRRLETYDRSATVEKLINMIGRGNIHISDAAELARSVVEDGAVHEALRAFSSLGSCGNCPSNSERDLHRWLDSLFGFKLQTYQVPMELEVPKFVLRFNLFVEGFFHNTDPQTISVFLGGEDPKLLGIYVVGSVLF